MQKLLQKLQCIVMGVLLGILFMDSALQAMNVDRRRASKRCLDVARSTDRDDLDSDHEFKQKRARPGFITTAAERVKTEALLALQEGDDKKAYGILTDFFDSLFQDYPNLRHKSYAVVLEVVGNAFAHITQLNLCGMDLSGMRAHMTALHCFQNLEKLDVSYCQLPFVPFTIPGSVCDLNLSGNDLWDWGQLVEALIRLASNENLVVNVGDMKAGEIYHPFQIFDVPTKEMTEERATKILTSLVGSVSWYVAPDDEVALRRQLRNLVFFSRNPSVPLKLRQCLHLSGGVPILKALLNVMTDCLLEDEDKKLLLPSLASLQLKDNLCRPATEITLIEALLAVLHALRTPAQLQAVASPGPLEALENDVQRDFLWKITRFELCGSGDPAKLGPLHGRLEQLGISFVRALEALVPRMMFLETLTLSDCGLLSVPVWRGPTPSMWWYLKNVDLSGNPHLRDGLEEQIKRYAKKLESINLKNCGVSVIPIFASTEFPHLRKLDLSGNRYWENSGQLHDMAAIGVFLKAAPGLEELYLERMIFSVREMTVAVLSRVNHSLKILSLSGNLFVGYYADSEKLEKLNNFLSHFTKLEEVRLSWCSLLHSPRFPASIKKIDLSENDLRDRASDAELAYRLSEAREYAQRCWDAADSSPRDVVEACSLTKTVITSGVTALRSAAYATWKRLSATEAERLDVQRAIIDALFPPEAEVNLEGCRLYS